MSQLYWDAAYALKQVVSKRKSLKSASFSFSKNGKALHELVRKVLPHYSLLLKEIKRIKPRNPFVSIVMLYDYYTKGKISGGGYLKRQIIENFKPNQIQETNTQPKLWVRVNRFKPVNLDQDPDDLVKNLYFVQKTREINNLIEQGNLISQSKASCLPVSALCFPEGSYNALDTCAAPGNKTMQLAEYLKEKSGGKVYAFEKDPTRFNTLKKRLEKCSVENVAAFNKDFFLAENLKNVKIAVVDPSCSGSGIIEHQLADHGKIKYDPSYSDDRVEKLALFQEKILEKVLSIKGIEQVVYSTCSVYRRENEKVIENLLKKHWKKFRLERILSDWKIRGIGKYGRFMIRCIPNDVDSQGFFVAKVRRRNLRLRHKLIDRKKMSWHYKKKMRFR